MSIRHQNLENILLDNFPRSHHSLPYLHRKDLENSPFQEEVQAVYDQMGGVLEEVPCYPDKWWVELEGVAVIFDDQLHFNRYRNITLRASFYRQLPYFPLDKYKLYCRKQETECLKSGVAGNHWTNRYAEQEFGYSEEPGDLSGKGSAAWKKRAFGDFLQDISPLLLPVKLLRLAVWDEVMINRKLTRLGDLLIAPDENTIEILLKYLERRLEQIKES